MTVTDAHLHLWDLSASTYRWMQGAPTSLRRTARWEEVAEDQAAAGVGRVVLIQADDTAEDSALLQRTAAAIEAADGPVAVADVVGWLPLTAPADVAAALADPAALTHLVGVRHLVHDEVDAGFLDRDEVAASLDLLARAGLTVDVPDAFPRHLAQTARVADRHPHLVLVLDHLGKPPLGDAEQLVRWETQLRELARRENVVAKISGLSTSGPAPDAAGIDRAVTIALEAFGPDRLLYGSDWPIAPTPFDLASGTGTTRARIARESPATQAAVLAGTAARVYTRPRG